MDNINVFIGSSTEGLEVAEILQELLDSSIETRIWNQDIFKPSSYTLKSLYDELHQTSFGIFVFSPDDSIEIRNEKFKGVRDNVIFELGLFMGKIGYENCFIVKPKSIDSFHLPSDLFGLNILEYNNCRKDGNLVASLGPVSTKIKRIIQEYYLRQTTQNLRPTTSLKFSDVKWLVNLGKRKLVQKAPDNYCYLIAYDIIGFESLNRKYGQSLCDSVLTQIDKIIDNLFRLNHKRIGDAFLMFTNQHSDDDALDLAVQIKDSISNYDWDIFQMGLYINISTSVCKHNPPEEVLNWVGRTMEYMKYVKSKSIISVGMAKNIPDKKASNSSFEFS